MRLWPRRRDNDWEYEPIGKSRRPRETLKETAEKILQKRMRQDPEYGLKAAERITKISSPEPKTLKAQLEELTELKAILAELGGTEQQGGLVSVLTGLFNSDLGQQIGGMLAGAANRPQDQGQGMIREYQPREKLQPPPPPLSEPPVQQQNTVHLGDLLSLLEMEPQEAVSNLDPAWIATLSKLSYPQVVGQLMPFVDDDTYGTLVLEILSEERKGWVQELLRLCQSAAKEA